MGAFERAVAFTEEYTVDVKSKKTVSGALCNNSTAHVVGDGI